MPEASLTRAEEIAKGLYPHQIEGIAFLLGRRRALLADDMGLGKTRQSVIAMVEAEGEGPYLVVHALTGTPMTSRPRDLFPLLQLLDHPLGKSFLSFAKRYCDAYQGDFGLVADGASNIEELTVQLHGVMLRRTKDEVLDLHVRPLKSALVSGSPLPKGQVAVGYFLQKPTKTYKNL